MNKIPYPILAYEIEKLYAKEFSDWNDVKAIEDHCEYIAAFIKAAGYTEEEYMELWMQNQENN
jgi:hypothetical protein